MMPQLETLQEEETKVWVATQEVPGDSRSMTRQPIVDEQNRVQGYEILFGIEPHSAAVQDNEAVRAVIDNLVLFGYDRLSHGLPVFIRCNAEVLADRLLEVLPPALTVVEIPQTLHLTSRLIEACWNLQQAGFRLALVDCVADLETHPLFDLLDYVKVDFICLDNTALADLRRRLAGRSTVLIAENVQWKEDFQGAIEAGFSLFQGACSAPPEPLRFTKIPANREVHIRVLQQLFPEPLNLKELCPLLMRDPSLVYRLLRLVSSPVCPTRRKVDSLQEAITLLGEDTVRRAATLAVQCELNREQSSEAVRLALVRARFCELAAPLVNLDADEQYLLGMMSMLSAMMRTTVTAQVSELSLRPSVVEALLGVSVPERTLLDWIEMLERNQFAECSRIADQHLLDRRKLESCYLDAVKWATKVTGIPA
jgi:c-di-GMP phosphodiesterase